ASLFGVGGAARPVGGGQGFTACNGTLCALFAGFGAVHARALARGVGDRRSAVAAGACLSFPRGGTRRCGCCRRRSVPYAGHRRVPWCEGRADVRSGSGLGPRAVSLCWG